MKKILLSIFRLLPGSRTCVDFFPPTQLHPIRFERVLKDVSNHVKLFLFIMYQVIQDRRT